MLIVFSMAQHHLKETNCSVLVVYCDIFIQDMSSQFAEDVDRLKSELLDEKEKQIVMEKSFSESEKHHEVSNTHLRHYVRCSWFVDVSI